MHKIQLGLIVLMAGLACFYCTTTVSSPIASASTASTTNGTISVTSATLDSGSGCVTNVNTVIDASVPSWISSNFKCQIIYTDGANYVFKSVNLPNHNSYYYCGSQTKVGGCTNKGTLYEALTSTHTCSNGGSTTPCTPNPDNNTNYGAGTNVIATQTFIYKIPITPTAASGNLTSTQAGQASIGITTNGLAIFNNAAAPPDTLATQAFTFDNYGGHPDNAHIYHHHSEVTKVSPSMASGALIGIMLDGYALYDEKCDQNDGAGAQTLTYNNNTAAGNSVTDTTGSSATTLDRLHGHTTTTKHFSTATYHYHYSRDATAEAAILGSTLTINGVGNVKTLVGSYFRGTQGSVSN
ncbi:MAG: YHYH protein [Spirochaetes bacterium]|nr:YHYH protein [Spirochaetota bacterium]